MLYRQAEKEQIEEVPWNGQGQGPKEEEGRIDEGITGMRTGRMLLERGYVVESLPVYT
jgi:hypothetical protein